MEFLILSDKKSIDAVLYVAEFLFLNSNTVEIFSLRSCKDRTFEMAYDFARMDPNLILKWQIEQEHARLREDEHWRKVQQKKELARSLRAEIINIQYDLSSLTQEQSSYSPRSSRADEYQYTINERARKYKEIKSKIKSKTSLECTKTNELRNAEKPPSVVIQPLPSNEEQAMQVLFFQHMPADFCQFLRLSFVAQQMLLPRDFSFTNLYDHNSKCRFNNSKCRLRKTIEVDILKTSIDNYYSDNSIIKHSNRAKISLMSTQKLPDFTKYGPQHIDNFIQPSDGVYHPNEIEPSLGWKGGEFTLDSKSIFFDPFVVYKRGKFISEEFTPVVHGSHSKLLSKFLFLNPKYTTSTRTNQLIAEQWERPIWLNKPQFFTFGSLRAYPNQQFRKLCIALQEKNLPLEQEEVQLLLQTTLYHIGELDWVDSKMSLVWKGFLLSLNFFFYFFFDHLILSFFFLIF
jgi:hypothetical protein